MFDTSWTPNEGRKGVRDGLAASGGAASGGREAVLGGDVAEVATACSSCSPRACVERQTRKSGVRPAAIRFWTLCCVGLVFSSPTTPITGTSETWKKTRLRRWRGRRGVSRWAGKGGRAGGRRAAGRAGGLYRSRPTLNWNWRRASTKGARLDVAHRAAELDHADVGRLAVAVGGDVRDPFDPVHDLVGHVGDHLHGLAEEVALPLLLQDAVVDLPRRDVVVACARGMGRGVGKNCAGRQRIARRGRQRIARRIARRVGGARVSVMPLKRS